MTQKSIKAKSKEEIYQILKKSEVLYKAFVKASADAVIITSLNGVIIDASPRAHELVKAKNATELIGKNGYELIAPEDRLIAKNSLMKVKNGEDLTNLELKFVKLDGTNYIGQMNAILIRDTDNNPIAFMTTTKDITEEKSIQDKMMKSEEQYRKTLDALGEALHVVNTKLEIILTNQAFNRWLKTLRLPEIKLNKSVLENFAFLSQEIQEEYTFVFNTGETLITTETNMIGDAWITTETRKIPIFNEDKVIQVITIIRDITEQKSIEKKLRESEEKYRTILEKMRESYFEVDLKGHFTFVNDAFCESLGYSRNEILGLNFKNLMNEKNGKKVFGLYNSVYKTGEPQVNFVYDAFNKKGEKVTIQSSAHLKRDSEGIIIGFYGIARDITEREKDKKELKDSIQKFRNIFEAIPDLFFLVSNDTTILDYQGKQEDLYAPPEEFLNKKMKEILPIELASKSAKAISKTLKTKKAQTVEYDLLIRNEKRFFEARHLYFSEKQVAIFIRDITDRKKAEIILKEERDKLKEIDEMRRGLITRVSHEIKTPLLSINASAELLQNEAVVQDKQERQELYSMIEKGTQRLNKLIERLLDISRIEYEKLTLDKEKQDVCDLIRKVAEEMSPLARARDIQLTIEMPKECLLIVDRLRFEQVITNLISNALKNTPPGGKITISGIINNKEIVISIKDTGVGLTGDEMGKIFERFGKIERHEDGLEYLNIQGSGLGLFISKEIVKLHEGEIWAESGGRNKGSIFNIRLSIK